MSSPDRRYSVLVAADALKETASSLDVVEAIAEGVRRASPSTVVDRAPLGDGGEGTLDVLAGTHADLILQEVPDCGARPDLPGRPARWGLRPTRSQAVVELAEAAGLTTVPHERRDPWRAGTASVGRVLEAARASLIGRGTGPGEIVLTVGGSATIDGGIGAARALGLIVDGPSGPSERPLVAGDLESVRSVAIPEDLVDRWRGIRLRIAADVGNPLLGPRGAARVFGPQKGADTRMIRRLEAGLEHWSTLLATATGVRFDGPGVGAAGGVVVGLSPLLGPDADLDAGLQSGFDLVAESIGLDDRLRRCDLVVTSEGCLDRTSFEGKVVGGVLDRAEVHRVPVLAVPGRVGDLPAFQRARFRAVRALSDTVGLDLAMTRPLEALSEATRLLLAEDLEGDLDR